MDKFYKKTDAFFITDNQDLQFILAKVRKLGEINKKVLGMIDPALARFCQVANISGNRLIILASNSSVATQIRFSTPEILGKLQKDATLRHVKEIQVKVGVPGSETRAGVGNLKTPKLSAAAGEVVRELADSLEDPKLREIMRRIAGRGDE